MIEYINEVPEDVKVLCEKISCNGIDSELMRNFLGGGSHGRVFGITTNSNMVVKVFNDKAIRSEYLDYIYLRKLQGITAVPVLYVYEENKFMIMENVGQVKVVDYIEKYGEYPPNFVDQIQKAIREIGERKINLVDIKFSEHFYWNEHEGQVKIIDFGVCDDMEHMPDTFVNQCTDRHISGILNGFSRYLK